MGCCESLPDVPKVIQPDPDVNTPVTVNVAKMGWSHDYAIYKGDTPPSDSEAKVQDMWVWFNKTNLDSRRAIIEVENFVRGNKEDKNKGMVLWQAMFDEKPVFDCFQKNIRQAPKLRFFAPFCQNTGYDSEDDDFYVQHDRHRSGFHSGDRYLGSILTKWSLTTKALIKNIDFERPATTEGLEPGPSSPLHGGAVSPGKDNLVLHVYSKGTVVTSYHEYDTTYDDDGVSKTRTEQRKTEHEFIDRIDYQLVYGDKVLYNWSEQGDSKYDHRSNSDINVVTPMYDLTFAGGFWSSNYKIIRTKKGCDPALAMLVAHLVSTEYSNKAIKADLQVRTPSEFPRGGFTFTW